jgi:hypothetical protein
MRGLLRGEAYSDPKGSAPGAEKKYLAWYAAVATSILLWQTGSEANGARKCTDKGYMSNYPIDLKVATIQTPWLYGE